VNWSLPISELLNPGTEKDQALQNTPHIAWNENLAASQRLAREQDKERSWSQLKIFKGRPTWETF
jgi:hypothetical protein